jgi:hypothetical protein
MVARMLEQLGLFQGWLKQVDHESQFFLSLSDWLLEHSHAGWDNPEPIRDLIENERVLALCHDYLGLCLRTPRALSFLGPRRFLRYRGIHRLTEPWGWKDPRVTYTLPVWRGLFPELKLIHVMRHGVDVAQSLRTRDEAIGRGRAVYYSRRRWLYAWWPTHPPFFGTSVRCGSLDQGVDLWHRYVSEARAVLRDFDGEAVEIRYEDFLAEPERVLGELAKLCDLDVDQARIRGVASGAKGDRAFAYRRSAELSTFAESRADLLASHGY